MKTEKPANLEVIDLFSKNSLFAMLIFAVLRFDVETLKGFAADEQATGSAGRLVGSAMSAVVGIVALVIIIEIESGTILANASALVSTVVSFIPVLLALAILWVTWKDAIGPM